MRGVETVLFLVIVATVVATFARRLRAPAPSLLVVVGVVVGLLPGVPVVQVTPEVISLVVLSALRQRREDGRISWQVPAVVSWAGARGVVPLAAALSLPVATMDGSPLPARDLVLLLTTAVIVLTLVVQGFTLAPLVRRAGIALDPADLRTEYGTARRKLAEAGLSHLDHLAETESAPAFVVDQLRAGWQARLDHIRGDTGEEAADWVRGIDYRALRRELIDIEAAELTRLFEAGEITDGTRRRIQRLLDLEHAGLED